MTQKRSMISFKAQKTYLKKFIWRFRENFLTDSQQKGERKSHEFHGGGLQH